MATIVPSVTAAVTPVEQSAPLTPVLLARLAAELGMELRDIADILTDFKISSADYEKLKTNETFQGMIDTARIEWQGSTNAATRNQIQSAFLFERAAPEIYARMVSGKDPLNHVVEAAKMFAGVAGISKPPNNPQQGERFMIQINLGSDTKLSYDVTKTPLDPALAALPAPEPVDDKEDRV